MCQSQVVTANLHSEGLTPWTPNFHLEDWIVALIFNTWFNDEAQFYLPNHKNHPDVHMMFKERYNHHRNVTACEKAPMYRPQNPTTLLLYTSGICWKIPCAKGRDRWEPLVNSIPLKL